MNRCAALNSTSFRTNFLDSCHSSWSSRIFASFYYNFPSKLHARPGCLLRKCGRYCSEMVWLGTAFHRNCSKLVLHCASWTGTLDASKERSNWTSSVRSQMEFLDSAKFTMCLNGWAPLWTEQFTRAAYFLRIDAMKSAAKFRKWNWCFDLWKLL